MDEPITRDVATVTAITTTGVKVEMERSGGCKSCSVSGLCFGKDKVVTWVIETDQNLAVGDRVELLISPQSRVLASLLVFLMPVLGLFAGYYLALAWIGESYAILGGFGLMILSFVVIWRLDKKIGKQFTARIGRKI